MGKKLGSTWEGHSVGTKGLPEKLRLYQRLIEDVISLHLTAMPAMPQCNTVDTKERAARLYFSKRSRGNPKTTGGAETEHQRKWKPLAPVPAANIKAQFKFWPDKHRTSLYMMQVYFFSS